MFKRSASPRNRRVALPGVVLAALLAVVLGLSVVSANVTFTGVDAQVSDAGVTIRWSTATEVKTAGFRIWARTAPNVEPVPISGLLPVQGDSLFGSSYSFTDPAGTPATRYFVEVIELNQSSTLVGPLVPLSNDSGTRLFLPLVVRGA